MIHQEFVISAFSESESMLPQEMISIGRPIPRKLKVDSAMIALLIFITTMNIIEETKFGSKCTRKICQKLPPMHFAAIRYSLSRSCRTSVRTIFAIFIQQSNKKRIRSAKYTKFIFLIFDCIQIHLVYVWI